MTLNKNYQTINGATDEISDIDTRHNTAMTEIEDDMTTIEGHIDSVANPHSVTKTQVGLGNCDNTADADKPVSSAMTTALNVKADTNSPTLVTPTIGVATATSVNKVAITAPATSATLVIADGKTLTVPLDATVSGSNTGDQTISDATISTTDLTTNDVSAAKHGFAPKITNAAAYLKGDGTWTVPAGAGDMMGPATNAANGIPQWNGSNSKTLKDGLVLSADVALGTSDTTISSQNAVKTYADTKLTTPGAWSTWTPTWTGLTKGTATIVAKYTQMGKTVHFRGYIIFAADTSISGAVSATLPVTSVSAGTTGKPYLGGVSIYDYGTNIFLGYTAWKSTTEFNIYSLIGTTTPVPYTELSPTVPMTWTTNDELHFQGTYEAA